MKFLKLICEALDSTPPLIALDLDETLISNVSDFNAKLLVRSEFGINITDREEILKKTYDLCVRYMGVEPLVSKHMANTGRFIISFPRPNLHEFINKCKSIAEVIIVTAASRDWADDNIKKWGIDVDRVVSAEDLRHASIRCQKCRHETMDDNFNCPQCGAEYEINQNTILVDDSRISPAKEKFLNIYGGLSKLSDRIVQVERYKYDSMAEYAQDNGLLKIMPQIKSKLALGAVTEGHFSMKLSQSLTKAHLQ